MKGHRQTRQAWMQRRTMRRVAGAAMALLSGLGAERTARAEGVTAEVPIAPPPINVDYLQFGVAINGAFALNPGPTCPRDAKAPCVLGSGGGLTARAGYRSRGPWYIGGAYGFSKIDTSGLMRMGVLQSLSGELRYLVGLGQRTEPYLLGTLGGVALGNEWGIEAAGAQLGLGAGFEVQLARTTVVGLSLAYRPFLLFGWTDRAGQDRPTGVAHYLGLDVVMEAREPLRTH